MNDKISTIRVEDDAKQDFLVLQRKHRYKNATMLISDMVFYFDTNDISPRQKDSVQKQMGLFRESLFKKLGAFERDYYKPHYGDFNLVSAYIKEQFEHTQKMIADFGGKQISKSPGTDRGKTLKESVDNPTSTISKKKLEGINYLLKNFENKCDKQGDKITVDEERYTQLKLSLMNILKRD